MAYVTPVHYYPTRERRLRLIVIHTMESPETDDTAENVAAWFAGPTAPLASAHACVDNNSVVLCLPPTATAWAAPGANSDGYQIEQAGRAAQGIAGWNDSYSQSMLRLSAAHARQIAQVAGIPLRHLTDAELAAGQAGFVGHDQVSRVYKKSDHTDPGPAFPWAQYMALVSGNAPQAPTQKEIIDMVNATHIIFQHPTGKQLYIANLAAGTYTYCPTEQIVHERTVVLERAGFKVAQWSKFSAKKTNRANLSAFGVEVK